ncbi:hypothetical protein [Paenibacillus sacheonensis]|uniref:Fungal lipase-like domain-containing protein n=1 Tax=Paenibacillus sacheonensis TaxID=742054 RepID=A0A7X5BXV4_9BACL|nr:hypothetical protein [Paenibacillus sacheonensis]MBM7567167.1 hypothetical protein [Paenibacillus sacheonensis]NBC70908.1 hypothetical protein [Paenibacillus sacheonensis]
MTDNGERKRVSLYLLAGLATAPQFMESFRVALHDIIAREGFGVRTSQLLFPYGDWSRRAIPQLWEISRDMRLGAGRFGRSIGGGRAVDRIGSGWTPGPGPGDRIVLVGHSGGGVAAVHAAWQLMDLIGGPPSPVVMIGSPRCRIPEELRESVLFVYAGGAQQDPGRPGRSADAVARLGTFGGGWLRKADKHAPPFSGGVPIIGKHADYFREREPYVNELGLTNQRLTLDVVWPWLRERI